MTVPATATPRALFRYELPINEITQHARGDHSTASDEEFFVILLRGHVHLLGVVLLPFGAIALPKSDLRPSPIENLTADKPVEYPQHHEGDEDFEKQLPGDD